MNPTFAVAIGLILHSSDFEDEESLTSFSKKIKLPSKGIVGKLIASIKDLLP